jgi:succinate dehydrogenase / fumarate reductase flavoprotein subunit
MAVSGYPPIMQESLRMLEQTRAFRATQIMPRMTLAEREELLREWHPDYREESNREVKIGPNKGQRLANRLVDLLETRGIVDPAKVNLDRVDYDVDILVAGAGGAGVTASLIAHENGAKVLLATKLRIGDANTIMAEGGIAAATRPEDSPEKHFLDTYGGGRFSNKVDVISALVNDAPLIVEWLRDLGCMFDVQPNGDLMMTFAGGHQIRRTHSCKDLSGMEFMRVLRDEFVNQQIDLIEFSPVVELLLDDQGRCAGALLLNLDTNELLVVKAKAVILATGGMGRLHPSNFPTTNHYGATADGLVVAYRAGANLLHMDSVQFHPTGTFWPPQSLGLLITETMRAWGAHMVNKNGDRFIHELETRDTEAASLIREVQGRGNGIPTPDNTYGIWLDTPMINILTGIPDKVATHFAGIVHRFNLYGIDVNAEPILIYPTQHYQNGGVEIDPDGCTAIEGLYAAGEVSGGVQGRNRLGSNSMTDIFVFGQRSARHAVDYIKKAATGAPSLRHVDAYNKQLEEMNLRSDISSPLLFPDYMRKEVRARSVGR